ncbi:hypothetical protein ACQP1P_20425 [Dactylosporangium sp. CA-052675]|uniref:hypothetical protein n=1 Tax=Dactylosporangium sp. CA-052675 TaxID=3239927 RepID=UPI003D93A7D3
MQIPRLVAGDFTDERLPAVTTAITMILSLPQAAAQRVEAIAIASGQGERWRLAHAIQAWESNPRLRRLLVATSNPAEATYVEITLDHLRGLGLRRTEGVEVQPEPAANTGRQAVWIAERVRDRGIGGLALAVSPYHLPRAYLTVLKELLRRDLRVPLIPVPVAVPPHRRIPETGATADELVPGELRRILTYMREGWVATPEELREYLRWLWDTHEPLLTGR